MHKFVLNLYLTSENNPIEIFYVVINLNYILIEKLKFL